jgi:hypothetical protein
MATLSAKEINDTDALVDRKIRDVTEGLNPDCFNWLYNKIASTNLENALKEHIRDPGQYFRKITAAFSDKEMEDAMIIGQSILNITPEVRNIVKESRIKEGLCLVNAMHITASVFINDNESGLHKDFDVWVEGSRA